MKYCCENRYEKLLFPSYVCRSYRVKADREGGGGLFLLVKKKEFMLLTQQKMYNQN